MQMARVRSPVHIAFILAVLLSASGCAGLLGAAPVDLCAEPCEELLCNTVSCDSGEGCVYQPAPGSCDDGSACTKADACKDGDCDGKEVVCDDGNSCTVDACDSSSGCTTEPQVGECDDGEVCTVDDACSGGSCEGEARSCDDGDGCTDDVCTAKVGCEYPHNTAPCSDGNLCTQGDKCKIGVCVAGAEVTCDDGNGCTNNSCDKKDGCSVQANVDACDDGDVCTNEDSCSGGACLAGEVISCDDDNACTADSCDPKGGCLYAPENGACTDDDACTDKGDCKMGKCIGSGMVDCDDNNPCTDNSCDSAKGCQVKAKTGVCDDNEPCTAKSFCEAGKCTGAGVVDCDDGNMCTNDVCDAGKGCAFVLAPGSCDDGDACTVGESCSGGVCISGPPTACDSCGNGAINVYSGKGPAACPDLSKLTIVKDMAALKAWVAKPTTSLQIVGKYLFAGTDLHLSTACDITLTQGARLDGVGHAVMSARKVKLHGVLDASGEVWLGATLKLDVGIAGAIEGPAQLVVMESATVAMLGDSDWTQSMCVEGGTVILGKPGAAGANLGVHKGAGKVLLRAQKWLDLHGQLVAGGPVQLQAGGAITVGTKGSLKGPEGVLLESGADITITGAMAPLGDLSVKATGAINLGADASLSVGNNVLLDAKGKFKIGGALVTAGALVIGTGGVLQVAEKAKLSCKGATLTAKTVVRIEGTLNKSGQLVVDAPWLDMPAGAAIKGSGPIDLLLPGPQKSMVGGLVDNDGVLVLKTSALHVQQKGSITAHKSVAITVAKRLDLDGKITKNKDVFIKAAQYTLTAGASVSGNGSCAIQGVKLPGSASPTGCTQL